MPQHSRERISYGRAPSVPYVQRARRICRNEFDHNFLFIICGHGSVLFFQPQNQGEFFAKKIAFDAQVYKSGSRHIGFFYLPGHFFQYFLYQLSCRICGIGFYFFGYNHSRVERIVRFDIFRRDFNSKRYFFPQPFFPGVFFHYPIKFFSYQLF